MRHVIFGLAAGFLIIILFYLLHITNEAIHALFIFNILFTCTFFPLRGSLKRKMVVLIVGNIICLAWSSLFSMFVSAVAAHVGEGFNVLLAFLSPLLNLLWIVSFWSISLTFLGGTGRSMW